MGSRSRLPIPFGYGLDRASSTLVVDPKAGADLRDVFLLEGKVRVRAGIGTAILTIAGTDAIVHQEYFKAKAKIVYVTYNRTTRDVKVYVGDVNGTSATVVSTWGVLAVGAVEPPRFSSAESFNLLVLAHDEPSVTRRLITKTYDGATLASLTANLDNTSAHNVLFRGVVEHLGYVWGWGFGSDADKSRPEMIRPSKPGDPSTYTQNAWFAVGERDDPILAARPCAGGLLVLKSSFRALITGADKASFGSVPVDRTYGQVAMRLSITVGSKVYAWTNEGPKASDGGDFVGLEIPLELLDRLPSGLPEGSLLANGHTAYFSDEKCICWFFPDYMASQTLVVAYSRRETLVGSRFSYLLIPQVVQSALVVAPSTESVSVDPGYATSVSHSGVQAGTQYLDKITFTINAPVGDETVELWGRQGAAAPTLITTFAINTSAGTQTVTQALVAAGSWDLWVRFTRGGQPRTDHPGSDPTAWPAASKGTGTVTALPALVPNQPTFTMGGASIDAGTWNASWNTPATGAVVTVYVRLLDEQTGLYTASGSPVMTTAANATSMGARPWTVAGGGLAVAGLQAEVQLAQFLTVNGIAGFSPVSAYSAPKFMGFNETATPGAYTAKTYDVSDGVIGTILNVNWTNSASVASATTGTTYIQMRWIFGPFEENSLLTGGIPAITAQHNPASYGNNYCGARGVGAFLITYAWVRCLLRVGGVWGYTRWAAMGATTGTCHL